MVSHRTASPTRFDAAFPPETTQAYLFEKFGAELAAFVREGSVASAANTKRKCSVLFLLLSQT